MSVHSEKSRWLIFLLLPILAAAAEEPQMELMPVNATEPKTNSTKDLYASETADPKKVDIVKQIRRLNEDGSYTVGYEAGDGTFKIESRDVAGNVKGTFGYIDEDGEIKRVSYSTSNTTQSPLLVPVIQSSSRFNRTSSSTTTRKPIPSIVYPKGSSNPTRQTVIQPIPRRRPALTNSVSTTESYRVVSANNNTNSETTEPPKILKQYPIFTPRTSTETIKSVLLAESADAKQNPLENGTASSTNPRTSLAYEKTPDRVKERILRPNTFRRQLNPTQFEHEQMFAMQQSIGDDTTDVYGGPILIGTARPLFTTTTEKPKLIPIQTILAARHRLNEKLTTIAPPVHEDQHETTLEATTNKIDNGNYVTANPVPIIQIPLPGNVERPYIKSVPVAHFRTREFLRDNPGAAIPIGNHRALYRFNPNIPEDGGQYMRQQIPAANIVPVVNHQIIQNENQQEEKANIIAIPVQEIRVPGNRYQNYNPYPVRVDVQQDANPQIDEFKPISAPVSTKDLKRLLQQLLVRQNRIQTLMDIREEYRPRYSGPYQAPLFEPEYRQKPIYGGRSAYPQQFAESRPYNGYVQQVQFNPNYPYQQIYQQNQYQNRNEYRMQQDEGYRGNEINQFDPAIPYESQRYVPKRRVYRPRIYEPRFEETNMAAESSDDQNEFLPPDVRESLLLKMLMLAIHPDFTPGPIMSPITTTPPPEYRKKVRNVQILGEENETKDEQTKNRA